MVKLLLLTVDHYAPVYVSGQKYDSTVRCTKCTIIVQDKVKCSSCVAYRHIAQNTSSLD